jgi:hypothetical protein
MADGPKIHKWLVPIASLVLGAAVVAHALDPLLGHPEARWYSSLSPDGQHLWNATVVGLAAVGLLIALASLIERAYWRLRKMPKGTRGENRPADAISNVYNWQLAGIRKAIKSFDRGEGIPHKRVKEWVESWGSSRELPKPTRTKT